MKTKVSSASSNLGQKLMPNEQGFQIFNAVNNQSSYTNAFIAFGMGALLLLFALFSLPYIVISPQNFTIFFTLSMLALLVGLAYMNGPQQYLKKLTQRQNLLQTSVLVLSIVFSLYFSLVDSSYIFSLFFCFIEVSYICNSCY